MIKDDKNDDEKEIHRTHSLTPSLEIFILKSGRIVVWIKNISGPTCARHITHTQTHIVHKYRVENRHKTEQIQYRSTLRTLTSNKHCAIIFGTLQQDVE